MPQNVDTVPPPNNQQEAICTGVESGTSAAPFVAARSTQLRHFQRLEMSTNYAFCRLKTYT